MPPFFLDCVLAIGVRNADTTIAWIGTGFLYGVRVNVPDVQDPRYATHLITNRHVRAALRGKSAFVRCNPVAGETFKDYGLPEKADDGSDQWYEHPDPNIDVAVIRANVSQLRDEGMKVSFFLDGVHTAHVAKMRDELGSSEGDFVYVLGFPMGLAAESNAVVARAGCIARIRDLLAGRARVYLVDSEFFPGNSGGPVVSRPEGVAIEGTKSQNEAYLIGIAHSYLSYPDTAVSTQTGRARVVFEENSGLALVHPVDCIEEVLDIALKATGVTRWVEPGAAQTV